jgi:hypothetical protein
MPQKAQPLVIDIEKPSASVKWTVNNLPLAKQIFLEVTRTEGFPKLRQDPKGPTTVGDTVTIAENTGRVDDLTLSYTYVDTGDGRLMVVPNEKVLSAPVFNHSTGDRTAPATVSVWLPPAASLDEARRVLKPAGATEVRVAEMTPEGVRVELKGTRDRERTQVGDEEAELRERAHEALRVAGLLEE